MRDHLHQAALDAVGVEDEEAERHQAHVRDRRVGDQALHVGLRERHEADVDHRDHRQRDHQPGEVARRVGHDRQREAHEAVGAELQQDRRQHHRAGGRRLGMRVGQPGMHRPHRHLDREREQEAEKQQELRAERQRQLVPVEDREAAARLAVQVEQGHQHQQRAHQRVQEELHRGVDAVRAAPHADDDEHRDQRALEEHVEQHRVEGLEHAVQHAGEDQERGVVLRHPVVDLRPAGDHHQHGDEAVQQHEQHRDAVDAEVVVDTEALDPGKVLHELHSRILQIKSRVKRDRHQEAQDRTHQGSPACITLAEGEHQHAGKHRDPDGQRQEHLVFQKPECKNHHSRQHHRRVAVDHS